MPFLYRYIFLLGFLFALQPHLIIAQESIRFAAVGDFGGHDIGNDRTRDVADLIKSWNPDFIITVGDNNYPKGEASTIDFNIGQQYHDYIFPYVGSYGPGATENRFFPALGNHDWFVGTCNGDVCNAAYFDYFTLPGNERYYDFEIGAVHFFVLDSEPIEPDGITADSRQAAWLRERLEASTACWQFVYFHHPPYTSSPRGNTVSLQWPFAAWGADVVMTGHEHVYERIERDGIVYVVNGLGGREPTDLSTPIEGSRIRYNDDNGAMRIEADCSRIGFEFINRQGSLIDAFERINTASVVEFETIEVVQQSTDIVLTWTTRPELNVSHFTVERSFNEDDFQEVTQLEAGDGSDQTGSYTYRDTDRAEGAYIYRIRWTGIDGQVGYSEEVHLEVVFGEQEEKPEDGPDMFTLEAAYPDPVSDRAVIRYTLAQAAPVRLVLYDVLGRPVQTLADSMQEPGTYQVTVEVDTLPPGTYYYHMTVGANGASTRKIAVRRNP